MMRTSNPALNAKTFDVAAGSTAMTIQGTVNRSAILLMLLFGATLLSWNPAGAQGGSGWMMIGLIGGLITAFFTIFNKKAAPVSAPIYAICEGLFLGGFSSYFERMYPGIVAQAILLTFGTLAALLVAYTSRLIRVTEKFKLGVAAATGGIAVFYFVSWIMGFFGHTPGVIMSATPASLIFSGIVVVVAALNLVLDFDFIEQGVARGAPKYMEWYAAFGLMVTLIWLYLEILRLLSKLNRR